jgi:hypothetical protein
MSSKSFLTSDMTSKNDIFMSILMYCYQKSSYGDFLLTPPFRLVLLLLQTTQGRDKSRQAVVHSLAQRQSGFQ